MSGAFVTCTRALPVSTSGASTQTVCLPEAPQADAADAAAGATVSGPTHPTSSSKANRVRTASARSDLTRARDERRGRAPIAPHGQQRGVGAEHISHLRSRYVV